LYFANFCSQILFYLCVTYFGLCASCNCSASAIYLTPLHLLYCFGISNCFTTLPIALHSLYCFCNCPTAFTTPAFALPLLYLSRASAFALWLWQLYYCSSICSAIAPPLWHLLCRSANCPTALHLLYGSSNRSTVLAIALRLRQLLYGFAICFTASALPYSFGNCPAPLHLLYYFCICLLPLHLLTISAFAYYFCNCFTTPAFAMRLC
jgi:hypothetical protein